ncbi:MAG TPA: HD domain-containing protein [Gemmatimonadales bacterium]|nr:HD domain-containing protein [Gemmatimonadales bacterium]
MKRRRVPLGRGSPVGHAPFEVVRDPLWNNIRLDPEAVAVVDTAAVQRLRYVRQLGHAFLVYPGATHSRFEHALGAYHLARRVLSQLEDAGDTRLAPADRVGLKLAALLHDIGHYPFSHALEEAGLPHHEVLAERHLVSGELAERLAGLGTPPQQLLALIRGRGRGPRPEPLAGLVAGSLDVDKLDYLSRDAWMCGVPYGVIDVDRLLMSLTVAGGPDGRPTLALHEKGLAALESLLFAKYQMYRNVYWHHAVRSATAMFKRLVRDAIAARRLATDQVAVATDDGLIYELMHGDATGLARRLRERRLAKRALDLPATELPADAPAWPADDPDLQGRVEDRLAREIGLGPGELFLDFPAKPDMLALDLPLVRRDGTVTQLAGTEAMAHLGLPRVAAELYRSARRLRVFVLGSATVNAKAIVELVMLPQEEVLARIKEQRPLMRG